MFPHLATFDDGTELVLEERVGSVKMRREWVNAWAGVMVGSSKSIGRATFTGDGMRRWNGAITAAFSCTSLKSETPAGRIVRTCKSQAQRLRVTNIWSYFSHSLAVKIVITSVKSI